MKRLNHLYEKIISVENLSTADQKARKGKSMQYGVILHDRNRDTNILTLHDQLKTRSFKTSDYTVFSIYEPKEREIYRLPYFPDRILHHAIMNILEPIFVSVFTTDTYSCIKGKGIHAASFALRRALRDEQATRYCLKLDVKKFYPSIDHEILKKMLRKKFKDQDLLWILDEIIDSTSGIPIGNYLSQYLANFYLSFFDHWIKEVKKVKNYFRYCDDMVILSESKTFLHQLLADMRTYLQDHLNLSVKENYQIFPVGSRSIDFVGYQHFHTHTLLRKSIKKRFARMLVTRPDQTSIVSYYGWAKHSDSKNLLNKLLN